MIKVAASRGLRFGCVWSRSSLVRRSAMSVIVSSSLVLRCRCRPPVPLAAAWIAFRHLFMAPFGHKLESQGSRNGGALDQLPGAGAAEPVGLAGVVADQRVARLVIAVVVVADRARRGAAIGAGLV